jgi:hypothetical protein
VANVATGKIDVALVRGPIGGHFAGRHAIPLQTVTFEDPTEPPGRLAFSISFGVRGGDKERSARIERLMRERASGIQAILNDSGVPLVDDPIQSAPLHQQATKEPAPTGQLVAETAGRPAEQAGPGRSSPTSLIAGAAGALRYAGSRRFWSRPSIGTHGPVQSEFPAAIPGIRTFPCASDF